jgi:hypothetical protein
MPRAGRPSAIAYTHPREGRFAAGDDRQIFSFELLASSSGCQGQVSNDMGALLRLGNTKIHIVVGKERLGIGEPFVQQFLIPDQMH